MKKIPLLILMASFSGMAATTTTFYVATMPEAPIQLKAEGETSEESEIKVEYSAWEKFVNEYLSAEKVAMYMSWVAYIGTIIGLVANVNKLKKANNLTLKNVSDDVQKKIEEVVGKRVEEESQKFLPAVIATQEKTNDILKIFSKILALSQENTPESRIAILQLIEEIGTAGKEIVENAKEAIKQEVNLTEEHKQEVEEKLDEIIEKYDGTSI